MCSIRNFSGSLLNRFFNSSIAFRSSGDIFCRRWWAIFSPLLVRENIFIFFSSNSRISDASSSVLI